MGPGDNIGLVASKTCSTGIRGEYYAIAAAMGKIGAFVGTYVFPVIVADGGGEDTVKGTCTDDWDPSPRFERQCRQRTQNQLSDGLPASSRRLLIR